MKIKLNGIEFEVLAVPGPVRAALLSDPAMAPAVTRDVYAWNREEGTGKALVQTTAKGSVPLPNGIGFFVPRTGAAGENGLPVKNEAASKKMGQRFVETVKAKSAMDIVKSLTSVVQQPQKSLPLKEFAPLNDKASYVIRMQVDFAVVQLRDASRNLGAYLMLPTLVAFAPAFREGEAVEDAPRPAWIVPAGTEANQAARRIAAAKRLEETQAVIKALPGGVEEASPLQRAAFARAVTEWKALMQPLGQSKPAAPAVANVAAAPKNADATS